MILVTGSRGLIGSSLSSKSSVVCMDPNIDLLNEQEVLAEFKRTKPDVIIHCAAKVGGIMGNSGHQGEFFYENLKLNMNVLEAARVAGTKKVISIGSSCAYPEKATMPFQENQLHLGHPYNSHFAYAYAKRMLEIQSRAYNEQYDLNYTCVIPSNIYGPNDKFDLVGGHVMPSLLLKGMLAKKDNTPFTIWGTGAAYREFIFVEDVADILLDLANTSFSNSITAINISSGTEINLKSVVNTIAKELDFIGPIIYDDKYPDGQLHKTTSIELLKSIVSVKEFTPIEQGIRCTLDWLKKHYPNKIRK